jgi:hypothetical protein
MDLNKALQVPGGREAIIKLAEAFIKKAGSDAITKFNESVPVLSQAMNEKISGSGISGTAQGPRESVPSMVDQAPPASTFPPQGGDQIAAEPIPMGPDPSEVGAMAAHQFLGPIMEAAMAGDPNAQAIIAQTATSIANQAANAAMSMQAAPPMDAGMVDEMGNPIDPNMMVDEMGNPMDPNAAAPMVDQNGMPIDPNAVAQPAPAQGAQVAVDQNGNPIPAPVSPEQAVADQIVPEQSSGPQAPVGEESGKDVKKKDDKKKTEGVQTDADKDAKKLASLNVTMNAEQLSNILALARMGKI